MESVSTFLSAGGIVLVALIEIISKTIDYRRTKKAKQSDKDDALREGVKWLLYDRIRYLALCYIRDEEIDFDERRVLRKMHSVYHSELGGNGDLDLLMAEVDKLPVITKKGVYNDVKT